MSTTSRADNTNQENINRTDKIRLAEETLWDMVVVGGGITGAGVAREASRRGLRVLLLEQKDFSWGTSSRSSKMVHGGLRYLAMGDRKLTKESLHERERLLQEAPALVERMGYYFLLPKSWLPWRLVMKILLGSYDRIAGIKNHKLCDLPLLRKAFNGLNESNISGAAFYTDAVTDDSRLVLRVLQEAQRDGATVLNYCAVSDCSTSNKHHEEGSQKLQTITVKDACAEHTFSCKARVVVNSTGAWADKLRRQRIDEERVRPLKGSHIVLKKGVLPIDAALSCQHPDDKRSVFVFPWEGHSVIGTTDLDYQGSLTDEASISAEELSYLLKIVNHNFPQNTVSRDDIVSTWSGVRPVIAGDKQYQQQKQKADSPKRKKPSKERRDHAVWDNDGLISAAGGKLTTFRVMALDVLERAAPYLHGFDFERDGAPVFTSTDLSDLNSEHLQALNEDQQMHLLACYGFRTQAFLAQANIPELTPIATEKYCLAQLRWALQHEWVEHLDDLLLRRTRLGLLLANGAQELLDQCRLLCQQELDWSDERWGEELARYQLIWSESYSLPKA